MAGRITRVELINYLWYSDDNNCSWKLGYAPLISSQASSASQSSTSTSLDDEKLTIYELSDNDITNLINENINSIKIDKRSKSSLVSRSNTHAVDPSHFQNLYDLCFMNNLHEAPLVDVLNRRFLDTDIYTSCGDVLISVNPYKFIQGLYDNPMRFLSFEKKVYGSRALVSTLMCVPHVYQIANNTLRDLMNSVIIDDVENIQLKKVNQSILISGESGAGKTEASKQVMNFLVLANDEVLERKAASSIAGGQSFRSGSQIKDAILESNIIFESFGNAKTVRNDNSSRFGKYIKLVYDEDNTLVSAFSETFLLEASRLVVAGKDERNYHIFYQLVRGLPLMNSQLSNTLQLTIPEDYTILNIGECTTIKSADDDVSEFNHLIKALTTLGFEPLEVDALCTILAVILHLGNVQCYAGEDESQTCIISSKSMSTSQISDLLGVNEDVFVSAILTHKMIIARRSVQVKILTSVDANNNIAALIKWIYGCIFKWIVLKINEANSHEGDISSLYKYIGILDIFGFETLNVNSFEQLCINFANERLQKLFNEEVFDLEQQYYATNGLMWTEIVYKDNQDVIDLISKKPTGLFYLLEQQSLMNRAPDDRALLNNFNNTHNGKNPAYQKSKFGNDSFTVQHFAGTVSYIIDGFIIKNNDSLHDDMVMVLKGTTNDVLLNIINHDEEQLPIERASLARPSVIHNKSSLKHINSELDGTPLALSGKGSPVSHSSTRASTPGSSVKSHSPLVRENSGKMASSLTVSVKFRSQVDVLLSDLYNTKPHYIKCIKSNSFKTPNSFDRKLVLEQLRYSGALEVVRIRREGYPVNFSFCDFYYEYELLTDRLKNISDDNIKRTAIKIANKYLNNEEYQIGYERIFLRSSYEESMSQAMKKMFNKTATLIQTRARIIIAKNLSKKTQISFFFIQRLLRGHRARKRVKALRKLYNTAQTIITAISRAFIYKQRYKHALRRLIKVQAIVRGFVSRLAQARAKRLLLLKLQLLVSKNVRGKLARKLVTIRKNALIKIQTIGRKFTALKNYRASVTAILLIQTTIRAFLARVKLNLIRTLNVGVIKLQATVRMNQARKKYEEIIFHVITIQSVVRKYLSMKSVNKLKRSVVLVQALGRSLLMKKEKDNKIKSIKKIQAFSRMLSEHKKFNKIIFSAIVIENVVRMFLSKRRYHALIVIRDEVNNKCSNILRKALSLFIMKMRVLALHRNCENGNALYISSFLKKYDYRDIRNKHNLFCTTNHSICRSGILAVEIFKTVGLTNDEIYSIDSNGNTILQYATTNPFLELVSFISSIFDGSSFNNVKDRRRNSLKVIRKSSVFLSKDKTNDSGNDDDFIETLQQATLSYADFNTKLKPHQLLCGWVNKRRNKKWTLRYMILEKDRIVYYKELDGTIQGTIMLDSCSINRVSDEQHTIEIISTTSSTSIATRKSSFLCVPVSSNGIMRSMKRSIFLKFADEKQLSIWLMLLKCINRSYLDNRKTDEIRIINHSLRTVWLNAKNKFDETALHTLVKQKPSTTDNSYDFIIRQVELIKWFVDNGCPIDTQDAEGNTPLLLAIKKKNIDAANTLIKMGANVYLANNHFVSSASILLTYINQQQPQWSSIWNESYNSASIKSSTSISPHHIRGYTYLTVFIRKIRYGGKASVDIQDSPTSKFAIDMNLGSNINDNKSNKTKQKLSKRLSIMMDDSGIDDSIDDSRVTYDAQLSVNVLNRAKKEIENKSIINNHQILGSRRHDDCNAILFANRWNMMTPLEVIEPKSSAVFIIESDHQSPTIDKQSRWFNLDLAVRTMRPGLYSLPLHIGKLGDNEEYSSLDLTTNLDIEIIFSLGIP